MTGRQRGNTAVHSPRLREVSPRGRCKYPNHLRLQPWAARKPPWRRKSPHGTRAYHKMALCRRLSHLSQQLKRSPVLLMVPLRMARLALPATVPTRYVIFGSRKLNYPLTVSQRSVDSEGFSERPSTIDEITRAQREASGYVAHSKCRLRRC